MDIDLVALAIGIMIGYVIGASKILKFGIFERATKSEIIIDGKYEK